MYANPGRLNGYDFAGRADLARYYGVSGYPRDLGLSFSSILKTFGPIAAGMIPVVGPVAAPLVAAGVQNIPSSTSGGSGRYWQNTPNKPGDPPAAAVISAMQNAPPDLVAQFIDALAAANNGERLSPSDLVNPSYAPYWIGAAMGGNDRKASTTAGKQANALLFEILKYAGGGSGTGSGAAYGGASSSTSVATNNPSTGGDTGGGWVDDIENIVKRALSAGGNAAAAAATAGAYQALPPSTQRQVVQQVAPGMLGGIPDWMKIGGGIAAGAVLLKLLSK